MESVRWVFRCGAWQPTREQWMLAAQCIQPEEKTRIGRFMFKKDSKPAMIGRLLIRKVVSETLKIPYEDISLIRTEKGKPYVDNDCSLVPKFNFNLSHQGQYAVLAAEAVHTVGIDVMKVEYPRGERSVAKYLQMMSRKLSDQELDMIRRPADEWAQLQNFYRIWCLKESYVKALGIGIGFKLRTLDFHVTSPLSIGSYTTDTKLFIDGQLQSEWIFQETNLDADHCVVVALQKTTEESLPETNRPFKYISFDDLIECAQPQSPPDLEYWENFVSKQEQPSGWKT